VKRGLAVLISIISGVLMILNSWSLFQQSSFYFTIACYLLAFSSLTILAAAFLLICGKRDVCWGALIAFYLGAVGGMLLLAGGT